MRISEKGPPDTGALKVAHAASLGAAALQTVVAAVLLLGSSSSQPTVAQYLLIANIVCFIANLANLEMRYPSDRSVPFAAMILQLILALASAYYLALSALPQGSKLYRLRLSGVRLNEISVQGFGSLAFSLGMATFLLLCLAMVQARSEHQVAERTDQRLIGAYYVLLFAGLVGVLLRLSVSRAEAFGERGEAAGQGALNLLFWAGPVGIILGIGVRHFGSRWMAALSSVVALLLVFDGNRSPLIMLALAIGFRVILTRQRVITACAVGGAFALGLFIFQSLWRGLVRDSGSASFSSVWSLATSDPAYTIMRSGFDTLEGSGLSIDLVRREIGPAWWDPAVAVLNFVPRALWSEKPALFGNTIGSSILGLRSGGVFLSGPGYCTILLGSTLLGATCYALVVLILGALLRRFSQDFVLSTLLLSFMVRFTLAGDPFDLFLTIQAILLYVAARYLVSVTTTRTAST